MRNILVAASALSLFGLAALPAAAHEADQVRHELRLRGYYNIRFLVAEPPDFQANACRDVERFHLHVDYYGRITERASIGPCRPEWSERGGERSYGYDRYRRW